MKAVKSKKFLKYLLGYSFQDLKKISDNLGEFYYDKPIPKKDKMGEPKVDKDGIIINRNVTPTNDILEVIQGKIQARILSSASFPPYVTGGVKKSSNVSNAKMHLGKKYFFCTDLKNYFPSIKPKHVYNMFVSYGFLPDIAHVLTMLTTHKNELPQGIHTSTTIANLVFLPYDEKIFQFCSEKNIVYNRFVDDLGFSSHVDFEREINPLITLILSSGFKINHRKTYYKIGPTEITGVITRNNKLTLDKYHYLKVKKAQMANKDKSLNSLLAYRKRVQNI